MPETYDELAQKISHLRRDAIEVKAAGTVRGEDFRGLRHLANRLGDRFRAGIVRYAGEQQLSFGEPIIDDDAKILGKVVAVLRRI